MKQWFMKWKWFQLHSHDFGKVRAFVEIYEIEMMWYKGWYWNDVWHLENLEYLSN